MPLNPDNNDNYIIEQLITRFQASPYSSVQRFVEDALMFIKQFLQQNELIYSGYDIDARAKTILQNAITWAIYSDPMHPGDARPRFMGPKEYGIYNITGDESSFDEPYYGNSNSRSGNLNDPDAYNRKSSEENPFGNSLNFGNQKQDNEDSDTGRNAGNPPSDDSFMRGEPPGL